MFIKIDYFEEHSSFTLLPIRAGKRTSYDAAIYCVHQNSLTLFSLFIIHPEITGL